MLKSVLQEQSGVAEEQSAAAESELSERPSGYTLKFHGTASCDDVDKLVAFLKEVSAQTFKGHQALSKIQTLKIFTSWNFESKHNELNTLLFGTFDYMRAELEVVYSGE